MNDNGNGNVLEFRKKEQLEGESETCVIQILQGKNGQVHVYSVHDDATHTIGMLEIAKQIVLRSLEKND